MIAPPSTTSFQQAKDQFDGFAIEAKYIGYWENVHSYHMRLITAYIHEAFAKLGCRLSTIPTGMPIPSPPIQRRHAKLLLRLFEILQDVGVVEKKQSSYIRASLPIETTSPGLLHDKIVREFPAYSLEHSPLRITASRFADCFTGDVEAVDLLFGTKADCELLQNVYAHAPVFKTATKLLCYFLVSLLIAVRS